MKRQKANSKKHSTAKVVFIVIGIMLGIELLVQIFWPSNLLLPNTTIDGNSYGLWDKAKVVSILDNMYKSMPVELLFGENTEPYISTSTEDVGMSISNARRISQIDYAPQWRLVPTSLLWYGALSQIGQPQVALDNVLADNFIRQNFGDNSYIAPINAGLVITEQSIDLKKSSVGGTFSLSGLKTALARPSFSARKITVNVDLLSEYPKVNDEKALSVATTVSGQLIDDLVLLFDEYDVEVKLPVTTIRSWITFDVIDDVLLPVINEKKLNKFLENEVASLVEKAAGTTTITTSELAGVRRSEGDEGKVLNTVETAWRLTEYLLGKRQSVVVAVESVDPMIEYVYERIDTNNVTDAKDDEKDDLETESLI